MLIGVSRFLLIIVASNAVSAQNHTLPNVMAGGTSAQLGGVLGSGIEESLPIHRSKMDVHKTTIPNVKERTCSLRLGVATDAEICTTVLLRTAKLNGQLLLRELAETDRNFLVRRIHIMTHEQDVLTINKALDVFLEQRPWWVIRKEVFVGLDYFNTTVGGGGGGGGGGGTVSPPATDGQHHLGSGTHLVAGQHHLHAIPGWSHVFLQVRP